eukprot:Opistho-1_new@50086
MQSSCGRRPCRSSQGSFSARERCRRVGEAEPRLERNLRTPSKRREARDIQQLARRAVGLAAVEDDAALEAHHVHHRLGEFADGEVRSAAHVDDRAVVAQFHQVDTGVGQVVDIQELAPRRPAAPDHEFAVAPQPGLVRLAQQGRQHMAGRQVVVVVGAVQVGRHRADVLATVLAVVAFAQLDAGDLGDRIGFVRRFERAAQKIVLADRLRAVARIDAARAEEEQSLHAGEVGPVDEIGLDQEVLVQEVGAGPIVGGDAADLGRSHHAVLGSVFCEERVDGSLVEQVQLFARGRQDAGVSRRLQSAHERGPHHAAVAGNEDAGALVHEPAAVRVSGVSRRPALR